MTIHYDIINSFIHPSSIKKALLSYKKGAISFNKLKEAQDNAIRNFIIKEKEYELPFLYDGQYRREHGPLDFIIPIVNVSFNEEGLFLKGPISYKSHPFIEEFKFIHTFEDQKSKARLSIPSPATFIHIFDQNESILKYYKHLEDFYKDVISIYDEFLKELYNAGGRYVLLEEEAFTDLEKTVLINNEMIDHNEDFIFSTHLHKDADYELYNKMASYLFVHEHVNAYFLECDHKSSYPLDFLKNLPQDKDVILRLLVANTPFMEKEEDILDRIIEASQYVSLRHLSLSIQGDFESSNVSLSEFQQWDKIQMLKDLSDNIWTK